MIVLTGCIEMRWIERGSGMQNGTDLEERPVKKPVGNFMFRIGKISFRLFSGTMLTPVTSKCA